jgi:uncharacterized coiled-coil DUF342 family protein
MAPKRLQKRDGRGGDRHKKNGALRASENRQKRRAILTQLQVQNKKLTEDNATLEALRKENKKLKQQVKDRVSMHGSCFLAGESVRQFCFKHLTSSLEGHHETGTLGLRQPRK